MSKEMASATPLRPVPVIDAGGALGCAGRLADTAVDAVSEAGVEIMTSCAEPDDFDKVPVVVFFSRASALLESAVGLTRLGLRDAAQRHFAVFFAQRRARDRPGETAAGEVCCSGSSITNISVGVAAPDGVGSSTRVSVRRRDDADGATVLGMLMVDVDVRAALATGPSLAALDGGLVGRSRPLCLTRTDEAPAGLVLGLAFERRKRVARRRGLLRLFMDVSTGRNCCRSRRCWRRRREHGRLDENLGR
ncbi:hypothetical protein PPTG_12204 [Phytophthora nicotianae INRA-310]|uniref:Uncharacterized protein n=2 Tax=Phytophthora nicotianae TaxID=4792 RepID=W2Q814_PHYN3|nr:hypothetical protein PPTG_12204 [Phytophthora nicotianae INRA-310]ETI46374.1 hypothetical protein F443_09244 [Phytophthora nicotianae P1569]ETN08405.1 hypothetical protein PPTG_12204 [Phytophthora nicotianae INRA-310]